MEPAEIYLVDLRRDITEFFNQVTDKLEYFRVYKDKWSNFSLDCNNLIQWIGEQEALIISILSAETSIELMNPSLFQLTNLEVVEKHLSQLTDQINRNCQLRTNLTAHQPAIETLVANAQGLIKSGILSTGVYSTDDDSSKVHDESIKSYCTVNSTVGNNIALNIATNLMQRYQTLISLYDRRSETTQTAQKMVEQLLTSCRNYDQWVCALRITLSDVESQMNSCDNTSSDKCNLIRNEIVDLVSRIESGENLVQLVKTWTDRYIAELITQANQRRTELETLQHSINLVKTNSNRQFDAIQTLINKPRNTLTYPEMDYQVVKGMVQALHDRFEHILKNVNQRSLSRDKFTAWIETTESQLELINSHMNLSDLSKIILDTPIDNFDKLIDKVINYMDIASESITQLAIDIRKNTTEIKIQILSIHTYKIVLIEQLKIFSQLIKIFQIVCSYCIDFKMMHKHFLLGLLIVKRSLFVSPIVVVVVVIQMT
ncbi:unnamed protein product [Heterobilharzia americana]|nr:unnamed protein product [Heterobilharzia americana]